MQHDDDSIEQMPFQPRTAPQPLRAAVEALCAERGATLDEMEQLTLGQIAQLARETYGTQLPEYWRIWNDWHDNGRIQPMGEL